MGILQSSLVVNGTPASITGHTDQSLLDILSDLDIHLPAACGGHGSCGLCRCRMSGSVPEPDALEKPYLSPADIEQGWRLTCRHGHQSGLQLSIPPALTQARRFSGLVDAIDELAPGVRRLVIKLDGAAQLGFTPGQWARLELPVGGVTEHRAFSFSSLPGAVEFIIKKVPGGRLTTLIHDQLACGDPVGIIGPFGDFGLMPESCRPMLWVAGGTGLAPFVSLLRQLEGQGELDRRPLRLLFAVHEPQDLFLDDWLRNLEAQHKNFRYQPFVSQVPAGANWQETVGRLPVVLRATLAELAKASVTAPAGSSSLALAAWEAYIAGSAGFVEAGRALLRNGGIPETQTFFERFI